jgi:hypothetical protein
MAKRAGKPVLVTGQRRLGRRIAGFGKGGDGSCGQVQAGIPGIILLEGRTAQKCFEAAGSAAETWLYIQFRSCADGQAIVPPLAGYPARPFMHPAADGKPAAAAGPEHCRKYNGGPDGRAIHRLGHRQAIAVISASHRPP